MFFFRTFFWLAIVLGASGLLSHHGAARPIAHQSAVANLTKKTENEVLALWADKIRDSVQNPQRTLELERLQKVLDSIPARYTVRDSIRKLRGLAPVVELFPTVNFDSVLARFPRPLDTAGDYEVLYDNQTWIVFAEGSWLMKVEFAARVLSQKGANGFASQGGAFLVELGAIAETRKPGGEVIRGAITDTKILLNKVEPGDVVRYSFFMPAQLPDRFSKEIAWNYVPRGGEFTRYARLHVIMPDERPLCFLPINLDNTLKVNPVQGSVSYLMEWHNLPRILTEPYGPPPDLTKRMVRVSSIGNWNQIAQWYIDRIDSAMTITEETKKSAEQFSTIFKESPGLDDKITAIYMYLSETTKSKPARILLDSYKAQTPDETLKRNTGTDIDIHIAGHLLLKALGIESYLVMFDTDSDVGSQRCPNFNFQRMGIMVKATRGWTAMDMTSPNFPIGSIPAQLAYSLYLPLLPNTDSLYLLTPDRFDRSVYEYSIDYFLEPEGNAKVRAFWKLNSFRGAFVRENLRKRKDTTKFDWIERYYSFLPNLESDKLRERGIEELRQQASIDYTCQTKGFAARVDTQWHAPVTWFHKLTDMPFLASAKRTAPIYLPPAPDTLREWVSFVVPGGTGVDADVSAIEIPVVVDTPHLFYRQNQFIRGTTFTFERLFVQRARIVPPADYPLFREAMQKIQAIEKLTFKYIPGMGRGE